MSRHRPSWLPDSPHRHAVPRLFRSLAILSLGMAQAHALVAVAQTEVLPGAQQAFLTFCRERTKVSRDGMTLHCVASPAEVQRDFARIERIVRAIRGVFAGIKPRNPLDSLEVWVIPDRAAYLGGIRDIAGSDGGNTGGMFCPRGRNAHVFVHGMSWPVLQHELWHAVSHVYLGDCAAWIDEGLAEVFERGVDIEQNFVIGAVSDGDLRAVRGALARGELRPTLEFSSLGDATWRSRLRNGLHLGGVQYTQAWITMQFLLFADEGSHRVRVNHLLRLLNQGRSSRSALNTAIGADDRAMGALDAGIRAYIERLGVVDPTAVARDLRAWAESVAQRHRGESIEADALVRDLVDHAAEKASLAPLRPPANLVRGSGGTPRTLDQHRLEVAPLDGMRWEIAWEPGNEHPLSTGAQPSGAVPPASEPPTSDPAVRAKPSPNGTGTKATPTPCPVRIRWYLSR